MPVICFNLRDVVSCQSNDLSFLLAVLFNFVYITLLLINSYYYYYYYYYRQTVTQTDKPWVLRNLLGGGID